LFHGTENFKKISKIKPFVIKTKNIQNLYCISNDNNTINNFHLDGCSLKVGKLAVGQTLGLAVINSFLIILAIAFIPLLLGESSGNASHDGYSNGLMPQNQQQYANGGHHTAVNNPSVAYNVHNPPQTYA